MKIIAGTGHRPDKLGGYAPEAYERYFSVALIHLDKARPDLVITGMALGWDTALAEAAFSLGIPFHAYIPFPGQERKWPADNQKLYRNLLAEAGEVRDICGEGYAAWKMQARNEAMVDALITEESYLLALWNGDKDGGTANCIRYAEDRGVVIINCWEEFQRA